MRSLLARLAALGAFAVTVSACGSSGAALPFAGTPNSAGGTAGTFQSGSNGTSLIRFVNGSPDYANVDVCIDNVPFGGGGLQPVAPYGKTSPGAVGSQTSLYGIAGGIAHTISVYPSLVSSTQAGLECPTAPGPYLLNAPIRNTTLTPGNNTRWTVILAGTAASGTLGLYIYNEPSYGNGTGGQAAISHNVAPAFSAGKPSGVGFGICTTTVTPCTVPVNLTGAQAVAVAKPSPTSASVVNVTTTASLNAIPAGFYDGAGVPAGTVVPITSIVAPNQLAGQPYIVELYAIDAAAGGLNLVAVVEQSVGLGF